MTNSDRRTFPEMGREISSKSDKSSAAATKKSGKIIVKVGVGSVQNL
jgi:hypothetical protein